MTKTNTNINANTDTQIALEEGLAPQGRELVKTLHYSTDTSLMEGIHLTDFKNTIFVEPFCGEYDLLNQLSSQLKNQTILAFDIKTPTTPPPDGVCFKQLDTLKNNVFSKPISERSEQVSASEPIQDKKYFVIANPPYLAKNKIKTNLKQQLNSGQQDLYEIFIEQLITSQENISGGVLILPLNFITGQKQKSLFKRFHQIYNIIKLNIFEKKVFQNTSSSVISFLFQHNRTLIDMQKHFKCALFQNENIIKNIPYEQFQKIINFEFKTQNHNYKIARYQPSIRDKNVKTKDTKITHIKINLIDSSKPIGAELISDEEVEQMKLNAKVSDRSSILIILYTAPNVDEHNDIDEKSVVAKFNQTIEHIRKETHSLVLSSYREYSRKRLTFEQAFSIIANVL